MAIAELPQTGVMSVWADGIYRQKYAHPGEEWPDTARRVATNVMGALGYEEDSPEVAAITQLITDRKFMPGGRYLYASGRGLHQTQNCVLLRADDSREGWADVVHRSMMALMTGAGIGINYGAVRAKGTPIQKTGGTSSGPISLMQIINEAGRHIMQGGSRRSAIWAGLPWWHADIFDFIAIKDWDEETVAKKTTDFNHPATLDMTNVSILLDDDFFHSFNNPLGRGARHSLAPDGSTWHDWAKRVYDLGVRNMIRHAEPGFSVDIGENLGEDLRNAPVAGGTRVLTRDGYRSVDEMVGLSQSIWTGHRWAENVVFNKTHENAPILKVNMTGGRSIRCESSHEFLVEDWHGAGKRRRLEGIRRVKAGALCKGDILHVSMPTVEASELDKQSYTLGFIYGDGSFHAAGGADLTLCSEESKQCVGALVGARSVNEHDRRGYTRMYFGVDPYWQSRRKSEFPESESLDWSNGELASFVAGLFDSDGNVEPTQRRIRLASKHEGFLRATGRALERLGIMAHVSKAGTSTYGKSQGYQLVVATDYNDLFVDLIPTQRLKPVKSGPGYRRSAIKVLSVITDGHEDVFCADVKVPEHSFMAEGVIISNCTEITSYDDSDICNLGSINLAKVESIEEMKHAVEYATLFLLAGTVYSHLPYPKIDEVRTKNRRLGLGIMGAHEWLLKRGYEYEGNDELTEWMEVYATSTEVAHKYADLHGLTRPVKTRAVAPTGTIGIVAETTTGIEPIFCVAFKRRYLVNGTTWKYQYVIDPTAERLIEDGISPGQIEDAYALSYNVKKRIAFQAWMQQYVDHGISSTINLPYPIVEEDEVREFKQTLMKYLPSLRGITCYPDGARGGQPLTAVSYKLARGQTGVVFEEEESRCKNGICGS